MNFVNINCILMDILISDNSTTYLAITAHTVSPPRFVVSIRYLYISYCDLAISQQMCSEKILIAKLIGFNVEHVHVSAGMCFSWKHVQNWNGISMDLFAFELFRPVWMDRWMDDCKHNRFFTWDGLHLSNSINV